MKRVLLVDDMKSIRSAEQAALDPYGLEIEQADSGAAGLQKILNSEWDLIFLDIEMPVMDGPTMLRLIRARGIKTPVVLVTSVSATSVLAGAIRLGAAHYISKPFTADQIRAAAVKLLKLDPALLDVQPPKVLLQHSAPMLPVELASLLPAHVLLDTSTALAQTIDLLEEATPGLVLVQSDKLGDQMVAVASVMRLSAPAAGIFAVGEGAVSAPYAPRDDLDGVLPYPLSEAVVHRFLYLNYLRPLVFTDGPTLRAAAFQGEPEHLPAYFASLTRHLIARCGTAAARGEVRVDLGLVPQDPEPMARLIAEVHSALAPSGTAVWFRPGEPMLPQLTARPELSQALLL